MWDSDLLWLVMDVPYLAHRAYHAHGYMLDDDDEEDVGIPILFGLLRDIIFLTERFYADGVIFCFDSKHSKRKEIYPEYKGDRQFRNERERKAKIRLNQAITKLRLNWLPKIGFRNMVMQRGYEADDMIAVVKDEINRRLETAIVVGSDNDLLQLLSKRISVWNPNKRELTTRRSFYRVWGIKPWQWSWVLSVVGGHDNIKGIEGVGNTTAARYLKGELKPGCEIVNQIRRSEALIEANMELVKLPFPGTKDISLFKDKVTDEKWRKVTTELGMKSIIKKPFRRPPRRKLVNG